MSENYEFFVAGVQHHGIAGVAKELEEGMHLTLIHEPTNQYDENAVKIMFTSGISGMDVMLGYVPKRISLDVRRLVTSDIPVLCEITRLNLESQPWNMLKVRVEGGEVSGD